MGRPSRLPGKGLSPRSEAWCDCQRKSRSTVRRAGRRGQPEAVPPRVTVVIPNWNGEQFLRLCLGSLRDQSFRAFETILVDNGSVDNSITFVEEHFPEVDVVPLGENRGIAAAFNAGIEASRTDRKSVV